MLLNDKPNRMISALSRSMGNAVLTYCIGIFSLAVTPSAIADNAKTILVMDASGSMWEKLADGYKIKIAQDVVNDIVQALPKDQEIGLISYGHRRKNDCSDIELMVPPGLANESAIRSAVESLNPKGKTPLSAAVIKAADELQIEENAATVILLSDGRETCDLDPCAVGAELEDRGIDFTAHVIGFDIAEDDARAQLKCLAENTGGKFLTANNASDLSQALGEVSREFQAPDFQASLDAADTAILGEFIAVDWTGPNEERDYIAVSAVGDSGYINFASTSYGNPAMLQMPPQPGEYEIRYVLGQQDTVIVSRSITIKAAEVALDAAAAASRGETILINWTGPNAEGDYIAVSAVGQPDYINYFFTAEGNPAKVQMPAQTGEYEIRYYLAQQNTVLASRPIIIKEGDVTLDAPSEAKAAQTVSVYWEGPNEVSDYIAVSTVDDSGYIHYFFTEYGNPAMLEMPSEPGEYELRYVLHQGNTILHSRPISVVE